MDDVYHSLSDALTHPQNCRELVVDLSQVDEIDAAITDLPHLETLVLRGDGEVAFPEGLGQMESITLVVVETSVAQLPAFVYELPNLESLVLRRADRLEGIDARAEQMTALRSLQLVGPSEACLRDLHHFAAVEDIRFPPAFNVDISQLDLSGMAALENLRRLVYSSPTVPESINALGQLEALEVDAYGFLTLPEQLDGLASLKRLTICASIDGFPEQILNLESLEELKLTKAKKEPVELPEKGWDKLSSLRVVTLVPRLAGLPEQFSALDALEELNINLDEAQEIPPNLFECTELRRLQFSVGTSSQIDVSDAAFSRLPNLESLELRVYEATKFPMELCQLEKLRELDLSANSFKEIPEEIGRLESLESLTLKLDFDVDVFPAGLLELHKLERLTLDASLDDPMPAEFVELQNLRELTIRNWRFRRLAEGFTKLSELEELTLANCALAELPDDIGALSKLRRLNVAGNELTELPSTLSELAELTELDVSRNPIEALRPSLGGLAALERLDVSHTQIRTLPPEVGELNSLTYLSANNTRLEALPDSLFGLPSLKLLTVSRSELSAIPESAGSAPALEGLTLSDNRISSLPASVIENDTLERLSLRGNEFTQAAMDALAPLDERLGYNLEKPRVRKQIAIPDTVSHERLSEEIVAQLERLDATLDSPQQVPDTEYVEFPFGQYPVPEAIRQFTRDISWPRATYSATLDWREAWMVALGIGWEHSEYECVQNHPYVGFGHMDGGNYTFLFRLDDPNPRDPIVYRIDHEDFARPDAPQFAPSLSRFLEALKPE